MSLDTARPRRRAGVAVLACGALVALTIGAAGAWACVPQPILFVQPRSSGPPGAPVTISAQNMSGRVELRWNALDGPLLATADGPSFSVPVSVPDEPSGLYMLVAFTREPDGGLGTMARAEFSITQDDGPVRASPASPSNDQAPRKGFPMAVAVTLALAGAVALFVGGATWSAGRQRVQTRFADASEADGAEHGGRVDEETEVRR